MVPQVCSVEVFTRGVTCVMGRSVILETSSQRRDAAGLPRFGPRLRVWVLPRRKAPGNGPGLGGIASCLNPLASDVAGSVCPRVVRTLRSVVPGLAACLLILRQGREVKDFEGLSSF